MHLAPRTGGETRRQDPGRVDSTMRGGEAPLKGCPTKGALRVGKLRGGNYLFDERATRGEQILDLRRILAARFREVGPAATAAAHTRRQLFDHLTGRNPFRQVRRDADDDGDLAVGG